MKESRRSNRLEREIYEYIEHCRKDRAWKNDRGNGEPENSGLCEVHFHDQKGKIIVTIEGGNISEEMKKMKAIQNMPGVLSADLAYSYSENEMLETIEHMKTADVVPAMLKEGVPGGDDSGTAC
jgi:nitrate reductase NapAB chaperone NapD